MTSRRILLHSAASVLAVWLSAVMAVDGSSGQPAPKSASVTPAARPTPVSQLSMSVLRTANEARDPAKYRVIFSADASFGDFMAQLNKSGQEGYRLKSVIYGWQRLSGNPYLVPVGILQSHELKFEYSTFEMTTELFFAIPGFEQEYARQSKKGFRLLDHFLSSVSCAEFDEDTVVPIRYCKSTYRFLLEREQGSNVPQEFLVAEAVQDWRRNPGRMLSSVIAEMWAHGFYPARVLSNNQILLGHETNREASDMETPEVRVVTSSFLNNVKNKVDQLGQEGFHLTLIGEECAVLYRRHGMHDPVAYVWLNARSKSFDEEIAKLQESGAAFRMIYRDPGGGNQLVFERGAPGRNQSVEYKVLMLNFQALGQESSHQGTNQEVRLDLTPAAKDTVQLINDLAGKGFVVLDLFVSDTVANGVGLLLQRSR